MSVLLDTNVVSEFYKLRPSAELTARLGSLPIGASFLSSITIGEIQFGVDLLPEGRRRQDLVSWFTRVQNEYANRILPFDRQAALLWGKFAAIARRTGRTKDMADLQIAATAQRYDLTLWTRNVSDFTGLDLRVVNRWETSPPDPMS